MRRLFLLAVFGLLPSLVAAEGEPFISTDPTVVCTTLEVIDGVAFFEGDIEVGECEQLAGENWEFRPAGGLGRALIGLDPGDPDEASRQGAVKSSLSRRWPDGIVPYEIDSSLSDASAPDTFEDIQEAIRHWADGAFIRLVPRDGEADFVRFLGSSNSCSSSIGRVTGRQTIRLTTLGTCGFGATVHEIGHAVGFFHEQSRADRDTYVTINYANIESGKAHNFNKYSGSDGMDIGPYDYGSIMHYSATAFSSNGLNTIDTDPTQLAAYQAIYGNVGIGSRTGLSPIDRATVEDVMNICYDGAALTVPYWTTSPWSACQSTCGSLGRTRVVSCRNAFGICADDSICSSEPKPAEQESCDPLVTQDFEHGPGGWDALSTEDDFDWTVGIRGTPSGGTGPSSDHTLGAGADGWYAFIEASSPRSPGDQAYLTSVPFTVPNVVAPRMDFHYWAEGSTIAAGALEVEIITGPCGGSPVTTVLWSSDGSSTAAWRPATVSLLAYVGQEVQLRFVGVVGSSFQSDVAIDDIEFFVSPCDFTPNSGCETAWGKAKLVVRENRPGRESLVASLLKGPALAQSDFGNPLDVSGTGYTVCLLDETGTTIAEMRVDRAAARCALRPCWKSLGGNPGRGYLYKDRELSSDGVRLLRLVGGKPGKSTIQVRGENNATKGYDDLPADIAAGLAGSSEASIEIHPDDGISSCFAVTLDNVTHDTGEVFKAKK